MTENMKNNNNINNNNNNINDHDNNDNHKLYKTRRKTSILDTLVKRRKKEFSKQVCIFFCRYIAISCSP